MATFLGTINFKIGTYQFKANTYDKDTVFDYTTENVVYVFLKRPVNGVCDVLYVGQTTQPACKRFASHEHWNEAERKGFSEIAIIPLNEDQLDTYEQGLIHEYNPPLNTIMYEGE